MFRTFIILLLAFVLGAVATYIIVVGGTIVAWDLMRVHDQDGGGAMALGLVIGPVCAIAGGVLAAFIALLRTARASADRPPQPDVEKRRDRHRLLVAGAAIIGGFVARQITHAIFWIVAPVGYDSWWKVQIVIWTPTIMMVLGALAAGYFVHAVTREADARTSTGA